MSDRRAADTERAMERQRERLYPEPDSDDTGELELEQLGGDMDTCGHNWPDDDDDCQMCAYEHTITELEERIDELQRANELLTRICDVLQRNMGEPE